MLENNFIQQGKGKLAKSMHDHTRQPASKGLALRSPQALVYNVVLKIQDNVFT